MKATHPLRSSSAFAGFAAAFTCSGIWLGLGLFVLEIQGGGVA